MGKGWAEISRISSEIFGLTGLGMAIPYYFFGSHESGILWMALGAIFGLSAAFFIIFKRMKKESERSSR